MYDRSGDGVGYLEVKVRANAAQLTNMIVAGPRVIRFSSKMKPRLRAEWVVFKEIFRSLGSCCLSPMNRNSVFEELGVKRLEVVREICCQEP